MIRDGIVGYFWLHTRTARLSVVKAGAAVLDRAGSIEMPVFTLKAGFADPCDFLTNCMQQSNLRC
jgi:hypothetical protein